jgi:hypothetical protein
VPRRRFILLLFYFIICVICGENLPSWQEPDPAHAVDMSARAWLEQSDSEDEESERRRSAQAGEQALLLYQQAFRFAAGNAPAQTALYREPIAAEQAAPAAAQVVGAQVVVGAAAPAAPAAAQVVVRKRPSSEVDLGDVPGRQQRLKLLHAAFLEHAQTFAEDFPDQRRVVEGLASDVLDPLAFEKEKLALEQAKLTLEKEKLTLEKEKLAVKSNEFALRKKQDEWEIEKKERMQRNDRWHQHQISRNSI